jgi:hypothetical protein
MYIHENVRCNCTDTILSVKIQIDPWHTSLITVAKWKCGKIRQDYSFGVNDLVSFVHQLFNSLHQHLQKTKTGPEYLLGWPMLCIPSSDSEQYNSFFSTVTYMHVHYCTMLIGYMYHISQNNKLNGWLSMYINRYATLKCFKFTSSILCYNGLPKLFIRQFDFHPFCSYLGSLWPCRCAISSSMA